MHLLVVDDHDLSLVEHYFANGSFPPLERTLT